MVAWHRVRQRSSPLEHGTSTVPVQLHCATKSAHRDGDDPKGHRQPISEIPRRREGARWDRVTGPSGERVIENPKTNALANLRRNRTHKYEQHRWPDDPISSSAALLEIPPHLLTQVLAIHTTTTTS